MRRPSIGLRGADVRWYHTLDAKQDRKVREQLQGLLKERHKRNWEPMENPNEMIGMKWPSGREELAYYRSQQASFWMDLAASYPDRAKWRLKRWAQLAKRYGPVLQVVA